MAGISAFGSTSTPRSTVVAGPWWLLSITGGTVASKGYLQKLVSMPMRLPRTSSRANFIPGKQIVVFGRSLGGAVAAQLATVTSPAVLVLEATFSSILDMTRELAPWTRFLPMGLLLKTRFDTVGYVSNSTVPKLIFHGDSDRTVPHTSSARIFAAAPPPEKTTPHPGRRSRWARSRRPGGLSRHSAGVSGRAWRALVPVRSGFSKIHSFLGVRGSARRPVEKRSAGSGPQRCVWPYAEGSFGSHSSILLSSGS